MAVILTTLTDPALAAFDSIIDTRSPAEYALDHLPGAINLPVLDDVERARVGTLYKQVSPFAARKLGAALLARNVAGHLLGPLADRPGGWRPLVYCWRGGQRSNGFATILGQIGWRVGVIDGGYKAWRGLVVRALYDDPVPAPVVVLGGNTGTAKTELLHLLVARGMQVIDLEGLANHRGSLFGAMGAQPSQRRFERDLALALAALDPARPVVVEAESAKVGECRLPPRLWKAMAAAPRIELTAPLAARADYLARTYADVVADPGRLHMTLDQLRPYHAAERIAHWHELARAGAVRPLAAELAEHHYDPRYRQHRARGRPPVVELAAPALTPGELPTLADRLAAAIAALDPAVVTPPSPPRGHDEPSP